jgi:hypothetical protein
VSDIHVDIGPVEQQVPSTSSQPSLALPGRWIRSDTRRYTQQDAAFRVLKIVPPIALAPRTLKSKRVPTSVLRTDKNNHRLQNPPSPGAARHTAPHRASGRSRWPTTTTKPMPHQAWSCAASTRNPLRPHLETTLQTCLSPNPTTTPPQSPCLQPLTSHPHTNMCYYGTARRLRVLRTYTTPGAASRVIRSLRSSLCPNQPQHDWGTALNPFPGQGLHTPLVLTAPWATSDLGPADDLSARMIDSYLLTGWYSTSPPPPFQLLVAWRLPPGFDSSLGIVANGLLNSPTLATRKPQPDR